MNETGTINNDSLNKILTIPNLLSLFRIALIPLFIWLYLGEDAYLWSGIVLIISGLTDIIDGFIARRFNLISNVGKVLDPVADKLTLISVLFCLVSRFSFMLVPLIILVIKEISSGILGLLVVRKTKQPYKARWHGKMATCTLYIMIIAHVLFPRIPLVASNIVISICIVTMFVSFLLYGITNLQILRAPVENINDTNKGE